MSLREQLDALEYPLHYPFKLVFRPRPTLRAEIETTLQGLLDSDRQWDISERPSSGGKFLALTIRIEVRSAQETEDLHRALAAVDGLLVSL